MAPASTKTNSAVPDFEAVTERARDANEQLLAAGRKISTAYLDGVESYVNAGLSAARELIAK